MAYQVDVRIELKDSDTGKVVTWDTDTFYCDSVLPVAQTMFDRVCDGAGKAAAECTGLLPSPDQVKP